MNPRPAAAVLASALALAPLASAAATPRPAHTIVRPGDGPPLAAVELWFRAPSIGFGDPRVGIAKLAAESVAASQGREEPLAALVQDRGGRLSITVFADSVQVSAVVPASAAEEIARVALDDYTRPALTEDGFKRARASVAVEAAEAQADPDAQLRTRLFAQLFAQGPDRYAVMPTVKQLGALVFPEVLAFAKRAFRAENAVVVVVGVRDGPKLLADLGGAGNQRIAEPVQISRPIPGPSPVSDDSIAGPALGFAFAGPPIADQRAATAMDFLSDYLLNEKTGTVARALRSLSPAALVSGQFITLHDPGILLVEVVGDASDAVREAAARAIAAVQRPLDAATFQRAQRAYIYRLLHDVQTAQAKADNLGWYTIEGATSYAPFEGGEDGEYLKLARALTPDYVAAVAKKYLTHTPAIAALVPASLQKKAQAEDAK
ncbi:MAG: insulinase family protein [bacterium]|nr:insulinase family protein [bacterium]